MQKKEPSEKGTIPRIIVFTNKKRIADDLANKAYPDGWPVDALHGDKLQRERDAILARFRSGEVPILIATDVAARSGCQGCACCGQLRHPPDIEDYVHRIGRTARGSDEKWDAPMPFSILSEQRTGKALGGIVGQGGTAGVGESEGIGTG